MRMADSSGTKGMKMVFRVGRRFENGDDKLPKTGSSVFLGWDGGNCIIDLFGFGGGDGVYLGYLVFEICLRV